MLERDFDDLAVYPLRHLPECPKRKTGIVTKDKPGSLPECGAVGISEAFFRSHLDGYQGSFP
jgi:hypothetical protein